MKGYYLWDWFNTNTIAFDANIGFHDDEYAKRQSAFRRFGDCKHHGITEIKSEIERLQCQLATLRKLKLEDVRSS